jgi:hypothetical protein
MPETAYGCELGAPPLFRHSQHCLARGFVPINSARKKSFQNHSRIGEISCIADVQEL